MLVYHGGFYNQTSYLYKNITLNIVEKLGNKLIYQNISKKVLRFATIHSTLPLSGSLGNYVLELIPIENFLFGFKNWF